MKTIRSFSPIRSAALIVALFILAADPATAQEPLPASDGKVILTVDGDIAVTNADGEAVFDHAMLAAIDTTILKTSTPWERGVSEFEGIRLDALLDRVGAAGSVMLVTALDGYAAEVPVSDVRDYSVILAWSRDGERMSVRERGPLWIIYPLDENPELETETYSARYVWQVERITVK